MEQPVLETLFDLLRKGHTVAQLATAVEKSGVHGWDRFGRFGQHARGSGANEQALNALAEFHQRQEEFWEFIDKSARPRPGTEPPDAIEERVTKVAGSMSSIDLYGFGWPKGKLPTMPDASSFPEAPDLPKRARAIEGPTLRVLGALLHCLSDLREKNMAMKIPSEDQLIGKMEAKFQGVKWIARNTIQYNFADAKKAMEAAKRSN